MDISIYVDTNIKNPKRGYGEAMYLIECIRDRDLTTKEGLMTLPDTTEEASILTAFIRALNRFHEPSEIKLFTKCPGIYYGLETKRVYGYVHTGYRTAAGKPVKNAELWSILLDLLSKHKWTILQDDHSYMEYMKSELKKAHKYITKSET